MKSKQKTKDLTGVPTEKCVHSFFASMLRNNEAVAGPKRGEPRFFPFGSPRRVRPAGTAGTVEGFTLLEILIALFIFTLLSVILVAALHSVINAQAGTEEKAERLRQLQMALLVLSRDIEQAINRPILNASGKEEAAFIGTPRNFTFTHAGFADPMGVFARSTLQRTNYVWSEGTLSRLTWPVLDQAPQTQPHVKPLLTKVSEAHFEYLGNDGRFADHWPLDGEGNQPLPRAVRIYLTISRWGKLSQLYVIPAKGSKKVELSTKLDTAGDKQ